MAFNNKRITLESKVSFSRWKLSLQSILSRRNIIGHVFNQIEDILPVTRPLRPTRLESDSDSSFALKENVYRDMVQVWKMGEYEAKDIIMERLLIDTWPENYEQLTASQLYADVTQSMEVTAVDSYFAALESFTSVRFTSTVDDYCNRFLTKYQGLCKSAIAIVQHNPSMCYSSTNVYKISKETAAGMFIIGTKDVKWLSNWRDTKAIRPNNSLTSLETMMLTIRTARKYTSLNYPRSSDTEKLAHNADLEKLCLRCRHKHKNKNCFKQNPELLSIDKGKDWSQVH